MKTILEQAKAGAKITLQDGRKWKFSHEGFDGGIFGIAGDEDSPSSWLPNGMWRRDEVEGCADLIIVEPVLLFENSGNIKNQF